jgi:hypothetical protein
MYLYMCIFYNLEITKMMTVIIDLICDSKVGGEEIPVDVRLYVHTYIFLYICICIYVII